MKKFLIVVLAIVALSLGLSDNVTYFSEALAPNVVSDTRYKVIFKSSVILPTFEVK